MLTCSDKLRRLRAVATRYDKRDFVWRGTTDVAAIRIWLREPATTPFRDTAQPPGHAGAGGDCDQVERPVPAGNAPARGAHGNV